ncbi:MAG: hypothetical protein Q9166_003705 [cf. Caloplaca sp. 2 TL-2023]
MERNARLEAILEGKYLSLQSDISFKERSFIVPVHDPQGSIAKSRYSKEPTASVYPASSVYDASETSTITDVALPKQTTKPQGPTLNAPLPSFRYQHEQAGLDHESTHPPPYVSPRQPWPPRSTSLRRPFAERASRRLSVTPSLIGIGYSTMDQNDPPTADSKEIISEQPGRISPMHVVKLPSRFTDEPPEEGTIAWLQVLAGFFIIMDAQGLNQSYGVFQAYYELTLLRTHTPSSIAWIGSLQIFLLFFMSIFTSTQIDKGRFQHCFTGGSLLLTLSVLATSFCTKYWQFVLAQGVGTGMGMGLAFGAGVPVLVSWFSSKELGKWLGVATGLASAGGSIGGMIFPAVCEKLIGKIGFPWTVRVVALIVLLTLLPANLIARERPNQQRRKGKPSFDWAFFTDIPYVLVMAGLFFTFWGVYFGFYYIVSFAQQTLHISATEAVNLLILMNASNLPGRFLPPLISDTCLGPLNTLIPCTFLTSCILFLWLGSSTSTSIHLVACFYGFAAAGVQSLYNACVWGIVGPSPAAAEAVAKAGKEDGCEGEGEDGMMGKEGELKGLFDEGRARMKLAIVFAMIGVACLTGAPLGGKILEKGEGSWVGAQVFAGSSVAVGGVLLVGARVVREGWGGGRV